MNEMSDQGSHVTQTKPAASFFMCENVKTVNKIVRDIDFVSLLNISWEAPVFSLAKCL